MYPYREELIQLLTDSIQAVGADYFSLPVAGMPDPLLREENYCAELFHQIRQHINAIPYVVNAEPNKKRHPIIEQHCGAVNPDLIIHHPGNFGPEDNLCVIEVKSSDGDLNAGIKKDIRTVNCMSSLENGYRFGVFIIFDELSPLRRNNLLNRLQQLRAANDKEYFLFLQEAAGEIPSLTIL